MRDRDRYLKQRTSRFYYVRRIPRKLANVDSRGIIRFALNTDNVAIARDKRDQLEKADNLYWAALITKGNNFALQQYQAAVERASLLGFTYAPAAELDSTAGVGELLDRLEAVKDERDVATTKAVLGDVSRPKLKLSKAFEVYISEIAASEVAGKSPTQRVSWEKVKRRALNNFAKVIGDIPLEEITRDDARNFYKWWLDRISPDAGRKALSPSSANRDVGNMRKFFTEYFKFIGEEERVNPFRNLTYSLKQNAERAAFPTDWIANEILKLGALGSLNTEARLIAYILGETGARPSEICNLVPENIRLDDEVPFIAIRSTSNREIKTVSSKRDIPLVGVSLAAMQLAPNGFPRYRDCETNLSATLTKAFRVAKLFPTVNHYIYSFRHSFEKRMTEAGIDYGLRCLLMGHATNRPAYGDGGSMSYRRDELMKIVLPYSENLLLDVS